MTLDSLESSWILLAVGKERAEIPEILIVEDEAAIARFLQRGLKAHGHKVVCAYDGTEGSRLA